MVMVSGVKAVVAGRKGKIMFELMRRFNLVIILPLLFSVGLFQGSKEGLAAVKRQNSPGVSAENTVAQVDDETIDVAYLAGYLSSRPEVVYSQVAAETVEKRLEELITGELLAKEAVRIGLDRHPEIRLRIQQMLAQNLLEEKVNKPVREREITDRELRAYYDEKRDEFQRPAQVRLGDILISVDPAATSGQRKRKKEQAEKVLAEVLAHQDERLGFGARILKYSDAPKEYAKGNTGFFDIQGKPIGLDSNLAREAFKLKETSQVCEKVVEAADGYHIIMLTGKREPVNRPFERVKEQLRNRIYRERIALAQTEYIESLKQKCRIKIDQNVLGEFVKQQRAKAATVNVKTEGGFPTLPRDVNVPPRKPRGPR
jgi:peptidyl-prolyl cis-trans isomerase C